MFREKDVAIATELAPDQLLHPNPFPDPKRDCHQKALQAGRRVGEIAVQDAIELQERLFVERDIIEIADADAAFTKAIINGMLRETRVVFFARESFLLRGRNDSSIPYQTSRAVVIKSGDSENVHRCA